MIKEYGYNDKRLVNREKWTTEKTISLVFAILFISVVWFLLNQKLLFGEDWISPTYDRESWRTNEGNLHTFGAWDFETHVWKTEFIIENFPNFQWNPYWYLGMPLLKYYQYGFYAVHIAFIMISGLSAAKSALYLIIFGHLLAVYLTFILCYKFSGKIWISAFSSIFLLASTFLTIRSYGWEPISVVFMFLYPLGLLIFFREPLKPFRFWLILTLSVSYLCHPLLFFALCMTMGIYLFSIAIRQKEIDFKKKHRHYLFHYFGLVFVSLLISAVQFFPQITYEQVTSGAHMGVSYIPFYHVPFNVISIVNFFFDVGNLKGPGLIIMISTFLLLVFGISDLRNRDRFKGKTIWRHELVAGLALVLIVMVLFYYMELYNIFPMNIFRSVQYHRIIPEFIIAAAVLISAMSNIFNTDVRKKIFYAVLIIFMIASGVVIYNAQTQWVTSDSIADSEEFIYDDFEGRISFPYTDQSLSVRNSFTKIPQVYGYYEQGITNSYVDELFSVSSGFHNLENTVLYLKAGNVKRLYINVEEGERDKIMREKMEKVYEFNYEEGDRYGYFEIPGDGSMVGVVDGSEARKVMALEPGCREIFKVDYCGSAKEEFVAVDKEELVYLRAYLDLFEKNTSASVDMEMLNPEYYKIEVESADLDTGIVVKMTYDEDFEARVDGEEIEIYRIGPEFMLLLPERAGDYGIELKYKTSKVILVGGIVSIVSFILVIIYFGAGLSGREWKMFKFKEGDL